MTDRPILFSGPMIRALFDDRKTQTRRVLKPQPRNAWNDVQHRVDGSWCLRSAKFNIKESLNVPYAPGDLLWVKETHTFTQFGKAVYRADARDETGDRWTSIQPGDPEREVKWKPSIYLPRAKSRLTLRVTEVRVQRVQEISERDAQAEGPPEETGLCPPGWTFWRANFHDLWEELNAKRGFGWDENPWVVALTFDVIHRNIDAVKALEPA